MTKHQIVANQKAEHIKINLNIVDISISNITQNNQYFIL